MRTTWGILLSCAGLLAACSGNSVVGGRPDAASNEDLPSIDAPRDAEPDAAPDAIADAALDAALDARPDAQPDAPATCGSDRDCDGNPAGAVCDLASGRCVACTTASDTCGAGRYCDAATSRCVAGCRDDRSCAGAGDAGVDGGDGGASRPLRCDTATRACVECLTDDQCPASTRCMGNVCVAGCVTDARCGTGERCCSGGCVDPRSNTSACGACGAVCAVANGAPACRMGACAIAMCTGAFGDCDSAVANGCETDTATSVANCGRCGLACPTPPNAAPTCAAGACGFTCAAGFADCDGDAANGCEVDLNTSAAHCGSCAGACGPANGTGACVAGACTVAACNTGFADCNTAPGDGCEVNTAADTGNCGLCGRACPTSGTGTAVCRAGACVIGLCTGTLGDCDGEVANGCETDTATSLANCGMCGRRCALPNAVAACAMSACVVGTCAPGFGNCDADAANGCETPLTSDANCGACARACGAGRRCTAGACVSVCATGATFCPATGACATIATDPANCGTCGTVCPARANAATVCAGAACGFTCNAGFDDCDADFTDGCEVDTRTSALHCGGCGRRCTLANAVAACAAGACAVGSCVAGFGNCDGIVANGCEAALTSNTNCGVCGRACGAGTTCAAGVCASVCLPGATFCPATGLCATTATDLANCGACGNVCPARANAAPTCAAGACGFTCAAGFADCDLNPANGCEVNTAINAGNCGRCGGACVAGATCAAGVCACPVGTAACAGVCTNFASDPANCGSCGVACGAGLVCVAGGCVSACPAGSTLCGGRCVLLGSDLTNCGACGRVCPAENVCSGGVCTPVTSITAVGCADGAREAYGDLTRFPNIAACSGGWTLPGIFPAPSRSGAVACATNGDDSLVNANGTGCSSADLCGAGWHICRGGEVRARAPGGCADTTFPADSFFTGAVSSTGCNLCALLSGTRTTGCTSGNCASGCREDPTLNNDFFGCGTIGNGITATSCDGLDHASGDNCGALHAPWVCGGSTMESITVTKTAAASGGVLCCR